MKKFSLTIFILFFISAYLTYAESINRNIQDNFKFTKTIREESTGDFASGQNIYLKIQKASNSRWFDFNDNTFKDSGWTTKETILTEDNDGEFYYFLFDPPVSEIAAEQYLFVYRYQSAVYQSFYGIDNFCYQDIGSSHFEPLSQEVIVGTNNDKNGYSVAEVLDKNNYSLNADQSSVTIGTVNDLNNPVTVGTNNDKSGYSVSTVLDKNNYSLTPDQSGVTMGTVNQITNPVNIFSNADISSINSTVNNIRDAVDGDKEGAAYSGIEKLIRRRGTSG